VEVTYLGGEKPARTDPDHPFVRLALEAAREAYGKEPVIAPMTGGSGPNHVFIETLHVPIVTAGVSYPGAQTHAPNENLAIDHFINGVKHTARILEWFGRGRG
jgi:acetylornithine deacetylase/succinyl-diaminopimelate desuccinylase-like protein